MSLQAVRISFAESTHGYNELQRLIAIVLPSKHQRDCKCRFPSRYVFDLILVSL